MLKENVMEIGYQEIAPDLLKQIRGNAWNIESMEGHGAEGRSLIYLGSEIVGDLDHDHKKGQKIYDYFKDNIGAYWFKSRALLSDGSIVSMERYLFGREYRSMQKKKRKVNKLLC